MAKSRDNTQEENPVRALAEPPKPVGGLMESPAAKRFWTTLDLKTDAGRRQYLAMKNQAGLTADDLVNKEFAIVNAIAHEVDMADAATGEVSACIRCVLMLHDGKTAAFVSQGVWSTLLDIVNVFGQPPWNGGIKCRLVRRKTRGGFSTLLLEVV